VRALEAIEAMEATQRPYMEAIGDTLFLGIDIIENCIIV